MRAKYPTMLHTRKLEKRRYTQKGSGSVPKVQNQIKSKKDIPNRKTFQVQTITKIQVLKPSTHKLLPKKVLNLIYSNIRGLNILF